MSKRPSVIRPSVQKMVGSNLRAAIDDFSDFSVKHTEKVEIRTFRIDLDGSGSCSGSADVFRLPLRVRCPVGSGSGSRKMYRLRLPSQNVKIIDSSGYGVVIPAWPSLPRNVLSMLRSMV